MAKYMVIKQVCCTEDTQFVNRMSHCEDAAHTAAGFMACVGDWCPDMGLGLFTGNLDGVVRISYYTKHFEPKSEVIQYIGNKDNYISDHNGVNLIVNATRPERPDAQFNIITHNLEGLCYRNDAAKMDRFKYVKEHLREYFDNYVKRGTLIMVQELALQIHKNNQLKQQDVLEHNMDIVLTELKRLNADLVGVSDGYTGCMIYDRTIWLPVEEIAVLREGSNKYSNCYLMKFLPYPNLHLWVVNIHLKAYGNSVKKQVIVDRSHINELSNIVERLIKANKKEYPIYLCGDFNNGAVKAELVWKATEQIQHAYKLVSHHP
jgi:hypothetical protein